MLESDSEAAHYLDGWIIQHFSDLALLTELQRSVDSLAPWFDENKAARVIYSADQLISRTRNLIAKLHVAIPLTCDGLTISWHDHKASFDYPIKTATKANIDQMRNADQCLDRFWGQVQKGVASKVKISLNKVLANRMFEPRQLWRTPRWSEPVQLPTPDSTPPKPTVTHDLERNAQYNSKDAKEPVENTPTKGKQKIKTRGQPAAPNPRTNMPNAALATPKVKISKKAFKVFSALLPSTDDVVQQGCEMAWDELLWAFDFIGLEPEKLHGSAWVFKPRPKEQCKIVLPRSIQFHEPKEVRRGAKIARPMVSTYGRRLKHAYGWTCAEDMFECE